VIPRGTVPLVREGIVTGKFKKTMPGVVTASAFSPVTSQEEVELADGDMRFHLYDFNFTDDVRVIAREDGLIAVNNAIAVDFGGQTASESIGARMFSGTGGQTVFAIGQSVLLPRWLVGQRKSLPQPVHRQPSSSDRAG
jgi:4-hydroxybutyrate CoA-transferase